MQATTHGARGLVVMYWIWIDLAANLRPLIPGDRHGVWVTECKLRNRYIYIERGNRCYSHSILNGTHRAVPGMDINIFQ